jgi:putative transposase
MNRDVGIPLNLACDALGVARSTLYRNNTARVRCTIRRRAGSTRALSAEQRQAVLDALHEPRFADQPPAQVYAKLLDEGRYLCSVRTMHRILKSNGQSGDRRIQRERTVYTIPRLEADRPNAVWTWDITKLATWSKGTFLNLYVVLDLYSRFVVAWMIAGRENSALSKQLLSQAITRYGIEPGQLRVHQDRGAPMTARGFIDVLSSLGVDPSHSRPRVSNDNAFSESQFKTLKYQPDYPGRFASAEHARQWCTDFFDWYNHSHQHSGLALFTPADVFYGRVEQMASARQNVLNRAHEIYPERFVNGRPVAKRPPANVAINPLPVEVTESEFMVIQGSVHQPPERRSVH